MLINLRTMLEAASAKKTAVGAFNVYNVESLQAVLKATEASNHAVILVRSCFLLAGILFFMSK